MACLPRSLGTTFDQRYHVLAAAPLPVRGSLREQVIYPFTYPEHEASGKTDEDLLAILKDVHLAYLPSREGGWETRKEWKDVLSGGEKQRMGMALCSTTDPNSASSTNAPALYRPMSRG